MALIGSINEQGELQGQINGARYLTGVITNASAVGGQVVGMRGLKGDKGEKGDTGATGADGADGADGQDGFSPSASVVKVGDTATITITDKDGTTTAEVYDGSGGGASAFIAEYGVTTYADVKDAYDEDAIIICTVDDSGNTAILQLAYFDDANDTFYFAQPNGDGWHWASVAIDDTWDDGSFQFANTDTATQLRDGLMSALDWQKLDGIASGAEVNVQSDWNEADSTADDYIKNKPTIPSATTLAPIMDGMATVGSETKWAKGDHVHPTDTSRVPITRTVNGMALSTDIWIDAAHIPCEGGENDVEAALAEKQDELVSGTNIKTINGQSLLGSGDLPVAPPVTSTDVPTADTISEFDSDAHMNSTDMTTGADSELEDFIDGLNVSGNTPMFTKKQKATNITAAAYTTGDASITVNDAILGLVVGVAIGGTDRLSVAQCYFESSTSIKCRVINNASSSQTCTFTVFYL